MVCRDYIDQVGVDCLAERIPVGFCFDRRITLEGRTFEWKVEKTFVNGHLLYTDGQVDETYRGQEIYFER